MIRPVPFPPGCSWPGPGDLPEMIPAAAGLPGWQPATVLPPRNNDEEITFTFLVNLKNYSKKSRLKEKEGGFLA